MQPFDFQARPRCPALGSAEVRREGALLSSELTFRLEGGCGVRPVPVSPRHECSHRAQHLRPVHSSRCSSPTRSWSVGRVVDATCCVSHTLHVDTSQGLCVST